MALITDWRQLMKYQDLIRFMPADVMELLDTMNELVPISTLASSEVGWGARLSIMTLWIRLCHYDLRIITGNEKRKIQHEMIHGCGGF